jgi:hypothetical protein
MATKIIKLSFIAALLLVGSSLATLGTYEIPLAIVVFADFFLIVLTATL